MPRSRSSFNPNSNRTRQVALRLEVCDFALGPSPASASHAEKAQYLRVYIGQIRQKIEDDPDHPKIILSELGIGLSNGRELKVKVPLLAQRRR